MDYREEYLKMRRSSNYDINWFYKYYIDNCNNAVSLKDFVMIFQLGNFEDVIRFMDYKLRINILVDSNGKEVCFD